MSVTTFYRGHKLIGANELHRNDGGRAAAGFRGSAGDCVTRAIVIAGGLRYMEVYDVLSEGCRTQRVTKGTSRKASARNGVNTKRKWFKDYMRSLGFVWSACQGIGTGCLVHMRPDELPLGWSILSLSRHYSAVLNDGFTLKIHDTHDPSRGGTRCVYGYWRKPEGSIR